MVVPPLTALGKLYFLRVLATSSICGVLHQIWHEVIIETTKVARDCNMSPFLVVKPVQNELYLIEAGNAFPLPDPSDPVQESKFLTRLPYRGTACPIIAKDADC